MFADRMFLYGIIICGLSYGTTMIFGLAGSFIIEHAMNYTPVVAGYGALAMGLAWMMGGFLGKATIDRPFLPKLRLANGIQIVITVIMIVAALSMSNIYTLVIFAFLIHAAVGFIFNNYFAFCLGRFPQMAGLTSGLSGGSVFIVTAVTSYAVVGTMHPESQFDMGNAYLIMGIFSLLILQFLLRPVVLRGASVRS